MHILVAWTYIRYTKNWDEKGRGSVVYQCAAKHAGEQSLLACCARTRHLDHTRRLFLWSASTLPFCSHTHTYTQHSKSTAVPATILSAPATHLCCFYPINQSFPTSINPLHLHFPTNITITITVTVTKDAEEEGRRTRASARSQQEG